jgi:hypothetical protein
VRIVPDDSDGVSGTVFANYIPDVSVNGENMPVLRRGNSVEVYVYYFGSKDRTVTIAADFYHVRPSIKSPLEKDHASEQYALTLNKGNVSSNDGSFDFPEYKEVFRIGLQSDDGKKILGADLDKSHQPEGTTDLAPALFPTEK